MKVVHAVISTAFVSVCLCASTFAHAQSLWTLGNYSIIKGTTTETVTPASAGGTGIYLVGSTGGGTCEAALYGASPGSRAYASAEFKVDLNWGGTLPPTIDARVRGKGRLTGNVMMPSTSTGTAFFTSLSVHYSKTRSTNVGNPFDLTYYSGTYLFLTAPTTLSFTNYGEVTGNRMVVPLPTSAMN